MAGKKMNGFQFEVKDAPMISGAQVLDALTKAVCAEYPDDLSMPSILISFVPSNRSTPNTKPGFYAAIRRYNGSYGKSPYVIVNTSGHFTSADALVALGKKWLGESDAKNDLRKALGL